MAVLTKAQIQTLIDTNLLDNTTGDISPLDLRDVCEALNDSFFNLITNQDAAGLAEYDITLSYKIDQCVVKDGDIYQADVQTTIGAFNGAEWTLISAFSESTSGLAGFLLKDNGFELEAGKLVNVIGNDLDLNLLDTGVYKVTQVSAPVSLSNEYPIAGKSLLVTYKSNVGTDSLQYLYPHSDLQKFYVRKIDGSDWVLNDFGAFDTPALSKDGTNIKPTFGTQTISGNYSNILGGNNHTINSSDYSVITGGYYSGITGGDHSVITGGKYHNITISSHSVISGGYYSVLNQSDRSVIIGGQYNTINPGSVIQQVNNTIIGGNTQVINPLSDNSTIIGSELNTITGDNSGIISSKNCLITGDNSGIIFGLDSSILTSDFSVSNGSNADITHSDFSNISNSKNCSVIGFDAVSPVLFNPIKSEFNTITNSKDCYINSDNFTTGDDCNFHNSIHNSKNVDIKVANTTSHHIDINTTQDLTLNSTAGSCHDIYTMISHQDTVSDSSDLVLIDTYSNNIKDSTGFFNHIAGSTITNSTNIKMSNGGGIIKDSIACNVFGASHNLDTANFCSVTGNTNTITSFDSVHILGDNITADADNTTYVENLNVKNVIYGDGSGIKRAITQLTVADSPYTASWGEDLEIDCTNTNFTLNLPTAINNNGLTINVTKIDVTNKDILIVPNGAEVINTNGATDITAQWQSVEYKSNGTNISLR